MDIVEGEFSKQASLVYHFGHSSPSPNIKLYNSIVTAMADKFRERCAVNAKSENIALLWNLWVYSVCVCSICVGVQCVGAVCVDAVCGCSMCGCTVCGCTVCGV